MATAQGQPNILLITSDQHHWQALGFNNPAVKTPNLDRLASRGVVFTRAYCPNPTCTPTRASIITGRYPSQHGAYSLGTKLMETEHTLGEDFTAAGYRTALVGKAHFQPLTGTPDYPSLEAYPVLQDLDFWREFHGPFYGFEHVELARNHTDEAHVGQHYALWMEENGCQEWRKYFLKPTGERDPRQGVSYADRQGVWDIPEKYHYNTWIADRSNALLQQYATDKQPFFLWSSFFDPHPSYLIPEPWASMYDPQKIEPPQVAEGEHAANPPHFKLTQEKKPDFSGYKESEGNALHGCHSHLGLCHPEKLARETAIYYGMVSCMDKYIGQILDQLEHLGLAENTIIVFTTDHGHFLGQHGLAAKGPFHYEDLIKIPFVVSWPEHVPVNVESSALQSLVDLAPTFLDCCGIPIPRCMTGISQKDVWSGEVPEVRDHVLVENRHNPTTMNHKTYVNQRYKLTVYYNQPYGELFDLQEDPGELHNRWDDPDCAALKAELLLKFVHAEMAKEPLPMPRIAGA
jgi:arylsulfatase A-like enzyme